MIKKLLAVTLSIFAAFAFAGCTKVEKEEEIIPTVDDETTVTLMAEKGHIETLYIQRIISLYEEKNPGYKIKTLPIDANKYETTASKMFSEGKIPDLFFHFNDAELARYAPEENFYFLENEEWVDELTESAYKSSLYGDDKIIGLPFWESSVSGCYYNKKILQELGLGAATSQGNFDSICKALIQKNKTPLYWAGTDGGHWMFQFGLDPVFYDKPEGPELLKKLNRGEISYADIPAVEGMISWFKTAHDSGWFNADYATATYDDVAIAMGQGKAAMFFIWDTFFSSEKERINGAGGPYTADDFALMPVFMGTAQLGTYEGGNLNLLMVNKNGKKRDLALKFLKFCATPENYNVAFDGVPTTACFKNQTTNIQSQMVTDAIRSVDLHSRPSTAWTSITGYVQNDVGNAVLKLFSREVDVKGCIALMDAARLAAK